MKNVPVIPMDRPITLSEWEAGRAARKEVGDRVAPGPCRRKESSADKRLRAAFVGKRAPDGR